MHHMNDHIIIFLYSETLQLTELSESESVFVFL